MNRRFPPGILISPNIRAWNLDEVERWLATRPSDRKPLPARSEAAERARTAAKRKRDADRKRNEQERFAAVRPLKGGAEAAA
jgi:hypothetical protein